MVISSSKIEQAMEQAVSRGVFPSAELLVAHSHGILFHKHFGQARPGTCFDIASLTKAIATATLAMQRKPCRNGSFRPTNLFIRK